MVVSNRNLLFQGPIFRGYVSFREGKSKTHNNSSTPNVELSELLQKPLPPFWGGSLEYCWVVVSNICLFSPLYTWGNDSIWLIFFQTGWFKHQLDWIQKIVDRSFGYCSPQEFLLKPTWSVWPVFDGHKLDLSKRSAKTWHIPVGNPCKGFPTSNGQTFGLWTSRVTRFMKCNVHLSLSYPLSLHPTYGTKA